MQRKDSEVDSECEHQALMDEQTDKENNVPRSSESSKSISKFDQFKTFISNFKEKDTSPNKDDKINETSSSTK